MLFLLANWFLALMPSTRWFGLKRRALRLLGISVGRGSSVCSGVKFFGGGRVSIGDGTWVGPQTEFHTSVNADIVIGEGCDIAPNARFIVGSHEIGGRERRAGPGMSRPIVVKDGCWIGADAMLLGGSTLAEGCILGARSLLLPGQYPADTLLVGSPARVLRQLD